MTQIMYAHVNKKIIIIKQCQVIMPFWPSRGMRMGQRSRKSGKLEMRKAWPSLSLEQLVGYACKCVMK
jgi:hypothetical protein